METMINIRVTADDFGYCKQRNEGIILLAREGLLQRLSLLVNGVDCLDAISAYDKLQLDVKLNIRVGLHLNLTEGIPITEKSYIPSLLDNAGHFFGKVGIREKLAQLSTDEIKTEIVNQIIKFRDLIGYLPAYVDGHQHVHVCPKIRHILSEVLCSFGITETRIPIELGVNDCTWLSKSQQCFFNDVCNDSIVAQGVFMNRNIKSSNFFVGLSTMGKNMTQSNVRKAFENILEAVDINEGAAQPRKSLILEFMVHPGYKSLQGQGGCGVGSDDFSMSNERETELNFLLNDFRDIISLFNFRLG